MTDFSDILFSFPPITLDQINNVRLLDRFDLKYIFHISKFREIMSMASQDYYILEIEGRRAAKYQTTYFDTSDFEMFTQHHNGKLNRYKVRQRTYVDSNLNFFEIKFKNNKGRTIKNRILLDNNNLSFNGEKQYFLEQMTKYKADSLMPAIQVNYNRITLVNKQMTERITIDIDLNYFRKNDTIDVPNMVIIEIKQDRSGKSKMVDILHERKIHPASLSKYCYGIANLIRDVKYNNFKEQIRYVSQFS